MEFWCSAKKKRKLGGNSYGNRTLNYMECRSSLFERKTKFSFSSFPFRWELPSILGNLWLHSLPVPAHRHPARSRSFSLVSQTFKVIQKYFSTPWRNFVRHSCLNRLALIFLFHIFHNLLHKSHTTELKIYYEHHVVHVRTNLEELHSNEMFPTASEHCNKIYHRSQAFKFSGAISDAA